MRQLKKKATLFVKHLQTTREQKTLKPQAIHEHVPYFSQWESRELVEKIITKQLQAKDDPRWQESGAKDPAEYTMWTWNCCGMACLKMILAHKQHTVIPLVTLSKQCLDYGGYQLPLENSPGLLYKPFVTFIKHEYGLYGKAVSALTITEIKRTLSNGGYVLASVTPEIRFPDKKPTRRGGHLVLLIGYDDAKQILYLHNPSGFETTQENVAIPYKNFAKFFDYKGILIFA